MCSQLRPQCTIFDLHAKTEKQRGSEMIETTLELIGSIASILGFSLRDLRDFKERRSRSAILVRSVARCLSAIESGDDGLVGNWTLERAEYQYGRHRGLYESGNASVLYPLEFGRTWQCYSEIDCVLMHHWRRLAWFHGSGFLQDKRVNSSTRGLKVS